MPKPKKLGQKEFFSNSVPSNQMRRLFDVIQPEALKMLGRHRLKFGMLQCQWSDLVGEAIGKFSHPIRIHYPSPKAQTGSLLIAAKSACAMQIQFSAQTIIKRVNGFFGYQAIDKLQIEQLSINEEYESGDDDWGLV